MSSTCPSVCLSVRPSVRYQTCEPDVLKMNEATEMPNGLRGKGTTL